VLNPKKLLAKKPRADGAELTLGQHLIDTDNAAQAIFRGRILDNWCRFFRVKDASKFLVHLQIASLFHDIGKANSEFLTALEPKKYKQSLRHEWLSAMILHLPSVRKWLEPSKLDLEVITAAVNSHHLKSHPKCWGIPRTLVKEFELYIKKPEVINILEKIGKIADVNGLPELPESWVASDRFWQQVYQDVRDTSDDFTFDIQEDHQEHHERRSLLLAVKAGLLAADSVASAMFRTDNLMEQWLADNLHKPAITAKEIETQILEPRYRQISEETKKPFRLKKFQEKAQEQSNRTLLLSACGSGKTIFGYKWHQTVVNRHNVGHIIFLYPTRGTATQGFRDYVAWAPETDASLLTGTASYELREMAENPDESASTKDKDFTTEERLFALGFWSKRFFAATVDQFLSFLTHSYSSLCLLPVLTDSVVVIDEVHSFSRGMFDNLISFLEHFDIPVLCMTATLPKTRRRELERVKFEVFASVADDELREVEQRDRYIIEKTDFQKAFDRAISSYQQNKCILQQNKCILWVVNTVDRCCQTAAMLEEKLGVQVLVYHSRFRLMDRRDRHNETVAALKFCPGQRKPVIAVTTQVCEMSLDLDADELITELAPVSSLVQRFGRSNRSSERDKAFRSHIFVYEPSDCKPYKEYELNAAQKFMAEVTGEVSQCKLADALERNSPSERDADGSSSFINGGYWAFSEPFRDTDDYSVNALLDSDLDTVKVLIDNHQPFDGYIVPVPNKKYAIWEERPSWMPRYIAMANSSLYSSEKGFGKWTS
jgi:CRISPR-associated endonuclease/helicase Cas3